MTDEKKPDEGVLLNEMLSTSTQTGSSVDVEAIFTPAEIRRRGDLRDVEHIEVRGGQRVYLQPSVPVKSLDELMRTQIAARHDAKEKILRGEAPLMFPQVEGVSSDILAQLHRMESVDFMPPETSGMSYEQRLEERKRIINEFALLNPFHAKLYPQRITFKKEFMERLEIVEDRERMRVRKNSRRRKAAKKRRKSR